MDYQDVLTTIAEVAVALAGFTGIVVVFGDHGAFSKVDVARLRTLLRASLSALFVSFVPVLVELFDLYAAHVWEVSCAVLGTVVLVNLIVFLWRTGYRGMIASQRFFSIVGAAIVIALLGAAGGAWPRPDALFIGGLIWQLFVAAQNFMLLLVGGVFGPAARTRRE